MTMTMTSINSQLINKAETTREAPRGGEKDKKMGACRCIAGRDEAYIDIRERRHAETSYWTEGTWRHYCGEKGCGGEETL